ncbi:MAG TPA: hypothetical protein VK563_13460 [Puia sp.]|nr:hypothetical protein [Puia sp.]
MKAILILLVLMILGAFCTIADAQTQATADSLIVHRYLNDTLGFTPYTGASLPGSVVPDKAFSYWELNMIDGNRTFTNLYRSAETKGQSKQDVLSKTTNGIGTVCPPGWCSWYISARKATGDTVTVTDCQGLGNFLGEIVNPYNAFFLLSCSTKYDSGIIPLGTAPGTSYKSVANGFLIIVNLRVNDCPVTDADLLYYVGKDKRVILIQQLRKTVLGGCI